MTDKTIWRLIADENKRQRTGINLIASENIAPYQVRRALASTLTNKYAEGYPGKRYYAGCQFVDQIEQLAIDRAKDLFGAQHANVQPHSGTQANMAAYAALLKPQDTVLAMNFAAGGHLSHGAPANFSGNLYNFVFYGVDKKTEQLDYAHIEELALAHKPKLIVAGASAYSRTIDFEKFARIAKKVNALFMVDMAHIAGLVAAGLHPNPTPYADVVTSSTQKTLRGPRGGFILCKQEFAQAIDRAVMPGIQGGPCMYVIAAKAIAFKLATSKEFATYQQQVIANAQAMAEAFVDLGYRIVSNGTDTHLFLIDLRSKNITGKDAEVLLESHGIYVNRNVIPYDSAPPTIASGIRIGTPFITSQGTKETNMKTIAHKIDKILKNSLR